MATKKVLAKDLVLQVSTTAGGPVEIKGINSFDFGKDYSDTDTTDNDSDGNQESLPTSIGRSVDIDGNRLEDSGGSLDDGQTWLRSYSNAVGYDAVAGYTLSTVVDGDTATQKIFDAWPEFSPISGGHEDHVAWSATLNVTGEVTTSTA